MDKLFIVIDEACSRESNSLVLVGVFEVLDSWRLASIRDLKREIEEQERLLELGLSEDEDLCPFEAGATGIVVVEEGEYVWKNGKYEKWAGKAS